MGYPFFNMEEEIMRKTKRFLALLLCALIMTVTVTGEPTLAAKTTSAQASTVKKTAKPPQNGWYTYSKNKKRYYRDGKYLKGYQKIGNTYYLFNKKGTQQKRITNIMVCCIILIQKAGFRLIKRENPITKLQESA